MMRAVGADDGPRPHSASELQRVLDAERAGEPFLMYRTAAGSHQILGLGEEVEITIGRGDANGLAFEWDAEVSRTHALLRRLGAEWVIEDNGLSSNGTFVNGERVTGVRRLRERDTVRCGSTNVIYRAPTTASATAPAGESGVPVVGELTATQLAVLTSLCRPLAGGRKAPATNPEIAAEVFLSVDAVKDHLRVLFRKFGLTDLPQFEKRVRLADEALRWGLVSEHDLRGPGPR